MGKRTRRKRQNNGNSNKSKNKPYDDNTTNNPDTAAPNSSVLLQRIRHSDPKTRHAALAAVANTLLDPSRTTLPKCPPHLLPAIRERVLDADLDVSQVAAGCLANYVSILASLNNDSQNSLTAGWTLVLQGRLKQCYEQWLLVQANNSNNNTTDKNKKKKTAPVSKLQKQWLALAVQCLRTLCLLMETNPQAVGRLTLGSMDSQPRKDFHQSVLEWMQQCLQYYNSTSDDGGAAREEEHYYHQILTLAARTLHSAWDDNADLLVPWKEECGDAFHKSMELLETIVQQPAQIPVVAQLHCVGCFLTARALVSPQQAQAMTQQTVLPVLAQRLGGFSWNTARALLQAYQQASTEWEKEQADDRMEQEIIRKVEERKEPARLIARRQKAKKDAAEEEAQKKKKEESGGEDNNTMDTAEETKDNEDAMDTAEEQHQQQVETQQALEQARDAWNQFLLPLQLSLELLANLTSATLIGGDDQDQEMMMDEDWGPDQEAQWMQEQQQTQQHNGTQPSAEEQALQKLLLESPLPQQLKHLSLAVYQVPNDLVFVEQSKGDLEDLQSKTMACLGNCWENISAWPAQSWAELQQAATTATGMGREGLVGAMVVALRTYPNARKEWQPEHVSFWLEQLGNAQNNNSDVVRRDIVTMLGILCSQEPHPVEVNQKICAALLQAADQADDSSSLAVPCEVLNVLMDMYGNDDDEDGCCHTGVFESLHVLNHFQRSIPTLKQKLKQQKGSLDKAEMEQWKETLLNGTRFVQYKKGQL